MWKFVTVFGVSLVLTVKGFELHTALDPKRIQNAEADITNECLEYSKDFDCKFYSCLEERFPCDSANTEPLHNGYCEQAFIMANQLNDMGQIWIKEIIKCFITGLAAIYKLNSVDCNSIDPYILYLQQNCFLDNDFCEVGWINRFELWHLFKQPQIKPLGAHYKVLWNAIGSISTKCTALNAPEITKWINDQANKTE